MKPFVLNVLHVLRLSNARRRTGPLMAQALYEPLATEDQRLLDEVLADYPELSGEFQALKDLSAAVVLSEDEWSGDLFPALQERLFAETRPVRKWRSTGAYAFTAATVLLGFGLYALFMLAEDGGPAAPAPVLLQAASRTSPLKEVADTACTLVAQSNPEDAASMLEQSIRDYPDDPYHADALLKLADIQYNYMQRYDKAYETYKELERQHRDVFNQNWDSDKRVRLLSAAFPQNFEPLLQLEAASKSPAPLHAYENILVQYPEEIWGEEAMNAMARLVAREAGKCMDKVAQLQQMHHVCSSPVALDRINLEIGNYYCDFLDDSEKARDYYVQAASSRHIALADQAREALARLD